MFNTPTKSLERRERVLLVHRAIGIRNVLEQVLRNTLADDIYIDVAASQQEAGERYSFAPWAYILLIVDLHVPNDQGKDEELAARSAQGGQDFVDYYVNNNSYPPPPVIMTYDLDELGGKDDEGVR